MNDVTKLVGGPAQALIDDAEIGHTEGGISATITPQNRMRTVDQYGGSAVAVIHTGDEVRVTIPWAEWVKATVDEIYDPGADLGASGIGIGRSAGYIYTTADLKIVPRLSADVAKKLQFYKACPIGALELAFDGDNDRIFSTEFACLVDTAKTDGNLIGAILVA